MRKYYLFLIALTGVFAMFISSCDPTKKNPATPKPESKGIKLPAKLQSTSNPTDVILCTYDDQKQLTKITIEGGKYTCNIAYDGGGMPASMNVTGEEGVMTYDIKQNGNIVTIKPKTDIYDGVATEMTLNDKKQVVKMSMLYFDEDNEDYNDDMNIRFEYDGNGNLINYKECSGDLVLAENIMTHDSKKGIFSATQTPAFLTVYLLEYNHIALFTMKNNVLSVTNKEYNENGDVKNEKTHTISYEYGADDYPVKSIYGQEDIYDITYETR